MKKTRMKYFSFDKIPYLYDMLEDEEVLPWENTTLLDQDLKVAG
jgi:hypothetical protein